MREQRTEGRTTMGKSGRSEPNFWGGYTHYDSNGKKIGSSEPGLFGGFIDYDAKGHRIGRTDPGLFGGYTHYDSKGHRTGTSDPGLFGGYTHYDSKGHKIGSSDPAFFGSIRHSSSPNANFSDSSSASTSGNQGCYIATCVYGSYDCPEVWTLRRFRDDSLAKTSFGRAFIKVYYAISPQLVARFGDSVWFKSIWKKYLDHIVCRLHKKGVSSAPYADRY